ncbi:S53 family peptidase [Aspergillus ruber CBS 135680]|uniref:tripeptidyl-peptidase II n=1 Tax=Aspergillus ruber (strain CBS 135680) TaxID=1388766 RepID=A0A017S2X4_ASPRC|nr:tripeptidyl aminopeptidase [Aspergillus ruber CBS 135680]EYE90510.1 tripeptidyl aminopeptidase [Aspergillus ruber CBS 135680]
MLSFVRRGALSLALVSLLTSSVAAEVFEKLHVVPEGWRYASTPNPKQPIRLQIALQQHDVTGFEQSLLEMSTPDHPNYGKHFRTHDEMKRMLLPNENAVHAVREWLQDAGISDIEEDADWVRFHTTVDQANDLLDANFLWYAHKSHRNTARLRTLEYSIPDSIAPQVNVIQPTTRFGQIRANRATHSSKPKGGLDELAISQAATADDDSICDQITTPHCLRKLYNVNGYKADPASGSKIGFASFLEEYARYSDLVLFEENLAPFAEGENFTVVMYNGGKNDQNSKSDSGEANLDLQYIVGMSAGAPVTEFSTAGRAPVIPDLDQPDPSAGTNEPYLEFLQNVLHMDQEHLPQVISTSYGENEQTIPEKYARTVCNMYAQLGSRGVSVIFSSGDSGVGSACMTNDGTNRTHFPPQFPASCPWVTSVGATEKMAPEQATYFSSGGFSDLFPRPKYQDAAVSSYLQTLGSRYQGLYNGSNRAFPDVSAQGTNFAVYDKGRLGQFDGTSCSAPAFSGIIALLNDVRLQNNKPVLGFLNPWLYGAGSKGLNDVVHGGSTGCDGQERFAGKANGSPVVPYASWNATQGWDPVTGLGTPDFGKLKDLALSA